MSPAVVYKLLKVAAHARGHHSGAAHEMSQTYERGEGARSLVFEPLGHVLYAIQGINSGAPDRERRLRCGTAYSEKRGGSNSSESERPAGAVERVVSAESNQGTLCQSAR